MKYYLKGEENENPVIYMEPITIEPIYAPEPILLTPPTEIVPVEDRPSNMVPFAVAGALLLLLVVT